ncbi:autotransporter assembly complex protein TamA [Thalassospira sp. MA62]|nr:autotransporter assembly complex protein TamA [Thalassospira sp. MA62]
MTKNVLGKLPSKGHRTRLVALLLAGTLLAACSSDGENGGFALWGSEDPVQSDLQSTISYDVEITGIDPQEERLIAALRDASTALRLQSRPTASRAGLQRRAEDDIERFQAVLRSNGFYDGQITFEINEQSPDQGAADDGSASDRGQDAAVQDDQNESQSDTQSQSANATQDNAPKTALVLTYDIDVGTPYLIEKVAFRTVFPDQVIEREATDEELEQTGLDLGERAQAEQIILAEQFGVDFLRDRGYPLARAVDRTVMADTALKTISITYSYESGEKANFGRVSVDGAEKVDEDFIKGYRSWGPGEQFSPEQVRTTRRDLAQSNLFDSVIVKTADQVGESGEIPVEITVVERKHRSIGGGVDFSTADGPGANAFWEHRNLFGAGEKLRLGVEASGLEQGLTASFRKPQFLRRRQALVAEGNAKSYDTDAYEGELIDSFAGVERRFGENWSATVGVTAEYSDLTGEDSPNEQFYLGGLRGILRYDGSDNQLDPTTGTRFEINVSPYLDLQDQETNFTSISISGSHYLSIDEQGDYVLAARARTGTILGQDRGSLPANKRFYSGGGGSIRGYEYQKVGPLADDGDPLGGRSVIEAGLEFRARVTDSFGVVPFVEGGNVYSRSEPEDLSLLWAAGLGFRYYTAVGPLRFDVAVPLDKRESVDDDYQFYISLGQAF